METPETTSGHSERPKIFPAYDYDGQIYTGATYSEALKKITDAFPNISRTDYVNLETKKGFVTIEGNTTNFIASPQQAMAYARKHGLVKESPHNFGELTPDQIENE